MIGFLELTDDQVAAWENIQAGNRAAREQAMTQMRSIREEIHAQLQGGSPDAATLGNLMIESHELGLQARAVREAARQDFSELLTGQQQDKFNLVNEYHESCRGSGGGKGHGRRGGGGGFGGPPGN
jgi:Spy/CpxP family protein refolding chaperone